MTKQTDTLSHTSKNERRTRLWLTLKIEEKETLIDSRCQKDRKKNTDEGRERGRTMERESEGEREREIVISLGWSVSEKPFFTFSAAFRQRDQKLQQSLKLQLRLKFKNGETRWLL